MRQPSTTTCRAVRGFTLIELMMVVLVIGVLISFLLVAAGGVFRGAKRSSAQRQLHAIAQAVEQFRSDVGYLPPLMVPDESEPTTVIDPLAGIANAGGVQAQLRLLHENRYSSEYTLAMYLIGAGNIDGDTDGRATGANTEEDDGHAGPGFLDPGLDRSWGGAASRKDQRKHHDHTHTGRVFGPYLDMEALGDALVLDTQTGLYKLVDPWGQPIRYYTEWPTVDPNDRTKSVARVPIELRTRGAVEFQIENGGTSDKADLRLERTVLNSEFMLLSAGKPLGNVGADGKPIVSFGTIRTDTNALWQSPDDFNRGGTLDLSACDPAANSGALPEQCEDLLNMLESNIRVPQ